MESDVAWRIERFRENLVSAGARVTVVAPLGALVEPEPVHGKGVFLDDHGPNKIAVIKVVLDHTACGLREAKELVESAPCVVGKELDDEGAARLKNDLLAAGARVR
jgi:large subunit ribosomal protein L7/L12